MTQFKVGDRVRIKGTPQKGMVREYVGNVPDTILVRLDSGVNTFYTSWGIAHVAVKTEPFYLLLVDGTGSCLKQHATLEEARTEAKRLLHEPRNQGKGITILRAVEYGRLPETEIEWRAIE